MTKKDCRLDNKSTVNMHPTSLSIGRDNNFIYTVNTAALQQIEKFSIQSKNLFGLHLLNLLNATICFDRVESKQLWKNLKMIDGDLPEILASALNYQCLNRDLSLKQVSELFEKSDPLGFYSNQRNEQKLYEHKLKLFLFAVAMGMTSDRPWLANYDNVNVVNILNSDNELICFHIYDFNLFRNYLLENTKFEQPSTGEDEKSPGTERKTGKKYYYGWLYENDGKLEYKINLQIRFK